MPFSLRRRRDHHRASREAFDDGSPIPALLCPPRQRGESFEWPHRREDRDRRKSRNPLESPEEVRFGTSKYRVVDRLIADGRENDFDPINETRFGERFSSAS